MPAESLAFRLLLAVVSVLSYAVLVQFTPLIEAIEGVPHLNTAFHLLIGAIFGAFVLAPYARAPRRGLRGILLALAAAAIYYAAIRFVVDGPASLDALDSFVIAGSAAALLCGLAVALIAPQPFWRRGRHVVRSQGQLRPGSRDRSRGVAAPDLLRPVPRPARLADIIRRFLPRGFRPG